MVDNLVAIKLAVFSIWNPFNKEIEFENFVLFLFVILYFSLYFFEQTIPAELTALMSLIIGWIIGERKEKIKQRSDLNG